MTRPGTGGILIPNTLCKVVSDWGNGRPYTTSERGSEFFGELCFKGPNVMDGYLNNEKATKDMIEPDGWLHTGDVGYIDQDGYFFVVDRIKELIKVKGFQVAPAELEGCLLTHPGIADCAVIGYSSNSAEEEKVIAYVVLKDQSVTAEQVMSFVSSHVAPHKQIKVVKFIAAIPKSASGKILRRVLKEQYKAELSA
jgi:acyl-CoA synthetase (AMP-forming)/AMP-acid ligase II